MMKQFPKSIYVVSKKEDGEDFLIASDSMDGLGIDIGDKTKIGLYKLEGFYDAEGMVGTSQLRKIK